MRKVIIESPYAGDVERNRAYLLRCIRDCLQRGEAPFASHQMYTDVLDDGNPDERFWGIMAGENWRRVADATVVYRDHGITPGMASGIHQASAISNHAVEYRSLEK